MRTAVLLTLSILAPPGAVLLAQGDVTAPAAADAWPDYRGPTRDGHAVPEARVPLHWGERRNVAFKVPVRGRGWSTPVVLEGRAWLTTAAPDGAWMAVVALDARTGETLHDRKLVETEKPARRNKLNSYASPSAVVEPGRVYVHYGTYGTFCLDAASGETVWARRDLNCDHMEGPGSSPILYGGLVIFNVDGADVQYVVALDKTTGETRWKTPRSVDLTGVQPDLRKAFSTPIVTEVGGVPRVISSGANGTMGYDPATGEEVWRVRYRGFSMSSRPLRHKDLLLINTGFMRAQLLAVEATGRGDVTEDGVVWKYARGVPRMPSPVLVDGLVYMVSDGGVASCVDAGTGAQQWQQRLGGEFCASPVYATGRIYFCDREGRTTVVAPGRKFAVLAKNQLGSGCMASPAVVGDALLLRTETHLYRIEEK